MSVNTVLLDRLVIHGLLGLRFWDTATERPVGDGLTVTAAPAADPNRAIRGLANRSGVYVFHSLPGLGAARFDPTAPTRSYRIEVSDDQGRFLPARFRVEAPAGLVTGLDPTTGSPIDSPLGSPIGSSPGIPLFSAPSRLVPAGMAVVRAELRDALSAAPDKTPAPFARLTLTLAGTGSPPPRGARGVADERGRIAIIFPQPAPEETPLDSPLGSPQDDSPRPLAGQTWSVSLSAQYARPASDQPSMDLDEIAVGDAGPDAELSRDGVTFSPSLTFTLAHGLGLVDDHRRPITPVLFVQSPASPL